MSKLVMFVSIAFILFSLAAGASWYLQHLQQKPEQSKAEDKSAKSPTAKALPKSHGDVAPLRPVIRPPLVPEADRMVQFANSLQSQQDAIKTREQQLVIREKQMYLIHDNIKKEQKKVDVVRKAVTTELTLVQKAIEKLEKQATQTAQERQKNKAQVDELSKLALELGGLEAKNLQDVAKRFDKMESDKAAIFVTQLIDRGNMDTAVAILSYMGDRQSAAVLGELSNLGEGMGAQILERIKHFKGKQAAPK